MSHTWALIPVDVMVYFPSAPGAKAVWPATLAIQATPANIGEALMVQTVRIAVLKVDLPHRFKECFKT
jgi:hypothetical protein